MNGRPCGILLPFIGAWVIWLGGYLALLAADFVAGRLLGIGQGLDQITVLATMMLLAGASSGFFLVFARRWRMHHRLLMLVAQAPAAYLVAVAIGYVYLCRVHEICP